MERVETGIPGLDPLIDGGIPKNFNVLVVGLPGTGKTILGIQYLYEGVLKGEGGVYVTLDARGEKIREQAKIFGWDLEKLEKEKKICILDVPLNRQLRLNLFKLIENKVKEYDAKRLVFDSLASFIFNINQFNIQLPNIDNLSSVAKDSMTYFEEDIIYKQSTMGNLEGIRPDPMHYVSNSKKRIIYLMFRELATIGTTNMIITSEASQGSGKLTVDGVSEFVCDGIIKLEAVDIGGGPARMLKIPKMRQTKNSLEFHNFDITPKGISVA